MNAKTIILLQLTSLIVMLGTAEHIFSKVIPTIVFIVSFALFAKCGVYINKNEKWLLKEDEA